MRSGRGIVEFGNYKDDIINHRIMLLTIDYLESGNYVNNNYGVRPALWLNY